MTRRAALSVLGASVSGSLAASQARDAGAASAVSPTLAGQQVCVLTPQQIEGPYYFDPQPVRSDIREDREGVPLKVTLRVIDAAGCAPIGGARVDIWHADALGYYSGYDAQSDRHNVSTVGKHFLRGTQLTDAAGQASFDTIYPGWYEGRTTHIHFKVFLDRRAVLVGQMYFPDALSEFIYANVAPYSTRGVERDTINKTDLLLTQDMQDARQCFCSVKEEADCYAASLILGVDREAVPLRAGPAPGAPEHLPASTSEHWLRDGLPPLPPRTGSRRPCTAEALVPRVLIGASEKDR